MKIKNLEIKNFKSIQNEEIEFDNLAIFVGSNGSGKSNFLKALEYFYDPKRSIDRDDFYNRNTSSPIEIKVTYSDLSNKENEHFNKYVTSDKELIVIKRFDNSLSSGAYYGMSLRCKDFVSLTRKPVQALKGEYAELRKNKKYKDLKPASSGNKIEEELTAWEEKHPEELTLVESPNQFFGFDNSSVSSLEKFTKFVYIPAVLYESHLEDTKNSPIGDLTDILARHKLKEDKEIKQLEAEIAQKYADKLKPFNEGEMSVLSEGLTKTLQSYYKDVGISIRLDENNAKFTLPIPKSEIKVQEGGYETQVSLVGQGLQRAFILSLLQYFAENKAKADDETQFNLILGIDEPELYQHPSKQKLFYKILQDLTVLGSDMASSIQCFYTTHSPLMIKIDEFNKIIRVTKVRNDEDLPSETKTRRSNLAELSEREAKLPSHGSAFTELKTLSGMVNVIDSRINEGFFSKTVVLVEGESDLVALKMAAKYHSKEAFDLDVLDISVISCSGKSNLEKPNLIFSLLGIPTYTIWDSDKKLFGQQQKIQLKLKEAKEEDKPSLQNKLRGAQDKAKAAIKKNKDLLAIHEAKEEDWPSHVSPQYACFENDIESLLKNELGEEYLKSLVDKHNSKIEANNAWKNPLVMTEVLKEAFYSGNKSATLEKIILAIVKLNKEG